MILAFRQNFFKNKLFNFKISLWPRIVLEPIIAIHYNYFEINIYIPNDTHNRGWRHFVHQSLTSILSLAIFLGSASSMRSVNCVILQVL